MQKNIPFFEKMAKDVKQLILDFPDNQDIFTKEYGNEDFWENATDCDFDVKRVIKWILSLSVSDANRLLGSKNTPLFVRVRVAGYLGRDGNKIIDNDLKYIINDSDDSKAKSVKVGREYDDD